MARSFGARGGCLATAAAVVVAVALVPFQCVIWDGGFAAAEFRLAFVDAGGRPVPGVSLRVDTAAGGVSYLYPVDEFVPGHTPTSDADGRMTVHHAGEALEFGGRECFNLVGMRFGQTTGPQYVCVFSLGGREVGRVRYDDLRPCNVRPYSPRVRLVRTPPAWPTKEDREAGRIRLFDGNGDGRLDREEAIAALYAYRTETREIEFLVVERTVVVDAP